MNSNCWNEKHFSILTMIHSNIFQVYFVANTIQHDLARLGALLGKVQTCSQIDKLEVQC